MNLLVQVPACRYLHLWTACAAACLPASTMCTGLWHMQPRDSSALSMCCHCARQSPRTFVHGHSAGAYAVQARDLCITNQNKREYYANAQVLAHPWVTKDMSPTLTDLNDDILTTSPRTAAQRGVMAAVRRRDAAFGTQQVSGRLESDIFFFLAVDFVEA